MKLSKIVYLPPYNQEEVETGSYGSIKVFLSWKTCCPWFVCLCVWLCKLFCFIEFLRIPPSPWGFFFNLTIFFNSADMGKLVDKNHWSETSRKILFWSKWAILTKLCPKLKANLNLSIHSKDFFRNLQIERVQQVDKSYEVEFTKKSFSRPVGQFRPDCGPKLCKPQNPLKGFFPQFFSMIVNNYYIKMI